MRIRLYEDNINEKHLQQVVACIRAGGVIIYPTDTVYAFGCDIYNHRAIERINKLKQLPKDGGNYAIICHDLSNLSDYSMQLPNTVFKLMKRALPGPFTFIIKANQQVPKLFHSKKKTIGIRVPDNNIARSIVKELGNPIVSSSINDEDDIIEYTTDPDLIWEKYQSHIDMLVDGGFGDNQASTVLDCTEEEVVVIREGKGLLDGLL